jgi:hypothetical protein
MRCSKGQMRSFNGYRDIHLPSLLAILVISNVTNFFLPFDHPGRENAMSRTFENRGEGSTTLCSPFRNIFVISTDDQDWDQMIKH